MRILAIGAHPDDIEIFMVGSLAAWKAGGADIAYAIATDGSRGGTAAPDELRRVRRDEARAAAAHLDVEPRFLGFPDGGLVADGPLIASLRQVIGDVQPDVVVTHALNDYHGDHRVLSEAVGIAANFHAPVLRADVLQGVGFQPTHYVDITPHVELKAAAIREHKSQDPERFVASTEQLGRFRASQANGRAGTFAECFRFEPVFPFVDIRELLPPAPPVRPVHDRNVSST